MPPKTLWGIANGNLEESWLLFVFSVPGRLAGTSLLMRDNADPSKPDTMWLYLRSFDHFEQLSEGAEKVVVPATALTYEDARGFIAVDKYRFRFAGDPTEPKKAGAKRVQILGCPRDRQIADALGYDRILIEVDRRRNFVLSVEYRGLDGGPLKTYEVLDTVQLEELHLPGKIRLLHRVDGFENRIEHEYWALRTPPDAALFHPSVEQESFLIRMQRFVRANGLGDRIDPGDRGGGRTGPRL